MFVPLVTASRRRSAAATATAAAALAGHDLPGFGRRLANHLPVLPSPGVEFLDELNGASGEEERSDQSDEQREEKQPADGIGKPEGETDDNDDCGDHVDERRDGLELAHELGSVDTLGEVADFDGLHGVYCSGFDLVVSS